MALHRVRDHDRLDGASNFIVWKARILSVLDRNCVKHFALKTIAVPVDPADNDRYEDAIARAKSIILDGVKDHTVPHIAEKNTAQEMWEALTKLYQHTSVQRKMILENQSWSYQMQKGKQIDIFLGRLKEIQDQLTSIGAMPDQELMVRTTLNLSCTKWGNGYEFSKWVWVRNVTPQILEMGKHNIYIYIYVCVCVCVCVCVYMYVCICIY